MAEKLRDRIAGQETKDSRDGITANRTRSTTMTDAINKMRLCIQEMKFCKSIIDCKGEVDEWCAHLFAIYITIRMDDFTKIVGKHIPKTDGKREYFTEVLTRYNDGYRSVRDKLGAHFQNPKETGDVTDIELQQRLSIYSSLDYDGICNLVDIAVLLFEIVCEDASEDVALEPAASNDLMGVTAHCHDIYMDDVAHLGVDAFAISGKNTGVMFTCSAAQQKAQLLKSLQLMTQTVCGFCCLTFNVDNTKRLFKRYFITLVINFYDNFVTRNIPDTADQYDEAFDKLIGNLGTKTQPKEELEKLLADLVSKRQLTPRVEKLRKVRDKVCSHLDLDMTLDDLNQLLDDTGMDSTIELYHDINVSWEYLLRHVFLLRMVAIPARSPLYGSEFVEINRPKQFYEENKTANAIPGKSIMELWHDVMKNTPDFEKSWYTLTQYLMHPKRMEYYELTAFLTSRFHLLILTPRETMTIRNLVMDVQHGAPEDILEWLLDVNFSTHKIAPIPYHALLYLLAQYADKDKENHLQVIIDGILASKKSLFHPYALLMLLHITMKSHHSVLHPEEVVPHPLMVDYINNYPHAIIKAAMVISLCSFWFESSIYYHHVKAMGQVTAWLEETVQKALDEYCKYTKVDEKMQQELAGIASVKRFVQLNYTLACLEKKRNQKKNPFLQYSALHLIWHLPEDQYEQCYHALAIEQMGANKDALRYMQWVADQHPLDDGIQKCLEDMKGRIETVGN